MSNHRVARAADQLAAASTPTTIAKVVQTNEDRTREVLEVDGVLFRAEVDQEKARRDLERDLRWSEIRSYGVPSELLMRYGLDLNSDAVDEREDLLRRIGYLLVYHGQSALWQVVYLASVEGSSYHLGDETLFLAHQPTSDQAGYNGPPTGGFNSAIEIAAELERRAAERKG